MNRCAGSTIASRCCRLTSRYWRIAGVADAFGAGAEEMLRLLQSAGPEDVAVCLLSGGGSALLPAPADGVTLADKQAMTKLLNRCGATIDEMNCVRKHLSRVKGGRLAEGFRGDVLVWLRLRAEGTVARCHLRDPSWFQWPLLEAAIEGNIVADFPLCNKSFNCSYSGHDL